MKYIYRIVTFNSMSGVGGARSRAQLSPDSLVNLMLNAPGHESVSCKNAVLSPTVMKSSYFYSNAVLSLRALLYFALFFTQRGN